MYMQVYVYTMWKLKILLIYWHILVHRTVMSWWLPLQKLNGEKLIKYFFVFYDTKCSQQWSQKPANEQYIEQIKSVWMHPSILFFYGKFWYIHPIYGYFFQVFCIHFLSLPCIQCPNILNTLFLYTVNLLSTITEDHISEPYKMGKNKLNHTWKVEIYSQKDKL